MRRLKQFGSPQFSVYILPEPFPVSQLTVLFFGTLVTFFPLLAVTFLLSIRILTTVKVCAFAPYRSQLTYRLH